MLLDYQLLGHEVTNSKASFCKLNYLVESETRYKTFQA